MFWRHTAAIGQGCPLDTLGNGWFIITKIFRWVDEIYIGAVTAALFCNELTFYQAGNRFYNPFSAAGYVIGQGFVGRPGPVVGAGIPG